MADLPDLYRGSSALRAGDLFDAQAAAGSRKGTVFRKHHCDSGFFHHRPCYQQEKPDSNNSICGLQEPKWMAGRPLVSAVIGHCHVSFYRNRRCDSPYRSEYFPAFIIHPRDFVDASKEIPDPSKHVPQVLGLTFLIGFVTAFPWAIAFLFTVKDYVSLVAGPSPVFEIFYQSIGNESVATFFLAWYLLIYLGATMSSVATTGRQAWAFARDNGTPCSKWMASVHPRLEVPLNATIAVTAVTCIYGAIYCGSTSAFNNFLNTAILFINVSYTIPQAIVIYRGRHILPERSFNAGRFGGFCNAFSALWMLLYTVLFSVPTTSSPSVQDMNYVSPVVVGITVIILAMWYGGKRKTFFGPVMILLPYFFSFKLWKIY
jgi:amino acid transporter